MGVLPGTEPGRLLGDSERGAAIRKCHSPARDSDQRHPRAGAVRGTLGGNRGRGAAPDSFVVNGVGVRARQRGTLGGGVGGRAPGPRRIGGRPRGRPPIAEDQAQQARAEQPNLLGTSSRMSSSLAALRLAVFDDITGSP
jgi:hypothetical protein